MPNSHALPTDRSRTENGLTNGRGTGRHGLTTDSRSAHARARNGLKTGEPSWGDRPTTDNQPAKPRNPHPAEGRAAKRGPAWALATALQLGLQPRPTRRLRRGHILPAAGLWAAPDPINPCQWRKRRRQGTANPLRKQPSWEGLACKQISVSHPF